MKKSLLALFLVVAVGLNLAGCSVGGNSSLGDSGAVSSKPGEEKRLNLDVFSDLGLTFAEIKEKRGEKTEIVQLSDGISFLFKNGYGAYTWYLWDLDWSEEILNNNSLLPKDEDGNNDLDKFPLPKSDAKSLRILNTQPDTLFIGFEKEIKASEIEQIYGLKFGGSSEQGVAYGYSRLHSYGYENFSISIYTNRKDDIIDQEAKVDISFINKD